MACHAGICELADSFRVLSLTATGCAVVDHNLRSGDDRGGVAVSRTNFFVTGDVSTVRMGADLSSITAVGAVHDGLISNVDTEEVYVLMTAAGVEVTSSSPPVTITQLGVLNPATGVLTATRIPLTMPIPVAYGTGIMSGYGEGLLGVPSGANLRWWRIELPSGMVTQLSQTPTPSHRSCESWAYWGIAERYAGAHYVVYVESTTVIARLPVPDVGTSVLVAAPAAMFTNLGDMCSITFSTSRNRWYFHHEYDSQFGGDPSGETAGYCNGTYDRP